MITEDYCSYEIAKLLKEKGFDEDCYTFYECDDKELYREERIPCCNSRSDDYAAPTHQMAMKWLRKVHNIYIGIFPTHNIFSDSIDYEWQTYNASYDVTGDSDAFFNIYEDAVEDVIKYCLENLI